MEATQYFDQYLTQAQQLVLEGKEFDSVKEHLTASGADAVTVETIIHQLRTHTYLKRRKRGFFLGLAGAIMLMLGFLLTVLFYHSGISIHYVMYGMTSIGAILLVAGLVEIIGW